MREAEGDLVVQSKVLWPEWLPAVALSSALASLMLLWSPPVGDLAAQVFRTELFQRAGLAIWNGSWYGGHYTLTYSVLSPPLGALLGPQLLGTLAVVASSYLFDRLVRDRWGAAARWATLWFAAGVVTLLADGQITFALGVAFALASLRCLQTGRGRLAVAAAAASALSSPVAAVFLAGVVLAGLERGPRVSRPALLAAALALALTLLPNLAFPEPGHFPFALSSYIAIPLWCAGALLLTQGVRDEERQLRRVLVGYVLASTLVWLNPNPLGGNAIRLGALFGGPVLAAVLLSRRPRPTVPLWVFGPLLAAAIAGSFYWQLNASVAQIARSVGDPSTTAAYFHPAARWLRDRGAQGTRIEVPPTANHWESAYLAPNFELARGWLRQLDTTRDDIFYDEGELSSRAYGSWLRGNAISFVALPDAPLDYSSAAEQRLVESAPPYLRLRFSSQHWRIYEVLDPKPLVAPVAGARARTMWIGRQGFALDVSTPGEFLVRVNFTPYWSISRGAGCIIRHGDWTIARAIHPGVFRVDADFSLGRAWNAVTGARKTC
ncbi:MAG TPA: hypothetical protein VHI77_08890 [Solirubrobacterales bacterium]|nr:hypothetical protein [Solirubrobacterales bacterium]